MARIGPADEGDLDPRAKEILDALHGEWGRTWNISRGLANNPAILEAFIALQAGLDKDRWYNESRRGLRFVLIFVGSRLARRATPVEGCRENEGGTA